MENKKKKLVVLKNRSDFQYIQKQGQRTHPSSWMIVNFKKNEFGRMRYGWTVPRYVGNAVTRNKLKRWCRECSRRQKELDPQVDINFVFKRAKKGFYESLKYDEFKKSFEEAIKKVSRSEKSRLSKV